MNQLDENTNMVYCIGIALKILNLHIEYLSNIKKIGNTIYLWPKAHIIESFRKNNHIFRQTCI
jgi:hypothetical protein